MLNKKKYLLVPALLITLITGGAFVTDNYFEIAKNLDIFSSMYKEVNTYYVDDIEPGKFMRTGIDAMLNSLDPYTNFYSEAESEDARFQITGQYGGIGATVGQRGDYIMITDPYEGYPAQKEDLRPGDLILAIDGNSTKGKTTADVSKLLKGQPGSEVKLLLKRGEDTYTKTLKREEIKVKNVPYYGMINETVGYIKHTGFTNDAGKEVREAIEDLKKNNKLQSLVLDLRGNPGGLLHEAVNIVNCFVEKGVTVVTTKGKAKEWDKEYKTLNAPTDLDIPLVVLTNRNSASASEIVSGTLQDLDRAVVVGQRSYGKGLVQSTRALSYNTQVKITMAKYYTPSGRCIQAIDYSQRNEDGSVGKIPDSLTHVFKTKGGRTVRDGGGITPDVSVEPAKLSNIARSLVEKNLIFDFASKYRNEHPSIGSARTFSLSNTDWEDFQKFISEKDYGYITETEKALEELKKKATDEKYLKAINDEIENMKKKLSHDKKSDIEKSREEITGLIEQEITRRYYYQKAVIESGFDHDADIKVALEVLGDMKKYRSLLSK